jgi:hypothetical protein
MSDALPRLALSIRQPWAWLIVNGHKDIENRDWPTKFRGLVCIHAGQKVEIEAAHAVQSCIHPVTSEDVLWDHFVPTGKGTGGIVGVAEIVDCVEASDSPWFVGRYGFVLANARPVDFIPVKGALGFFDWRKSLEGGR